MSDSTTTPALRPPTRKTAAPEPAGSVVLDVGKGFIVTVTASGKLRGVRATKCALERSVRLCRKAMGAGITDDAPFQELLAAISEAEKLARAAQEANDRVTRVLAEHRTEPAAGAAAGPNVPPATSVETRNV